MLMWGETGVCCPLVCISLTNRMTWTAVKIKWRPFQTDEFYGAGRVDLVPIIFMVSPIVTESSTLEQVWVLIYSLIWWLIALIWSRSVLI